MSSKHTWYRACASVLRRALKEQVDLALKGLELRPRNILRYRYGLHHALGRALTLDEVRTRTRLQCRNCLVSIAYPAIQPHQHTAHLPPVTGCAQMCNSPASKPHSQVTLWVFTSQVGELYGLKGERVRQIEGVAMAMLKKGLEHGLRRTLEETPED